MRSSHGKEMEGASSDAKEIEGQSPSSSDTGIACIMKLFPFFPALTGARLPCFTLKVLPIYCLFPVHPGNETIQQIEG